MARKKRKKKKKAGVFDKFLGLMLVMAAFALGAFIIYKTIADMDKVRTWTKTTAASKWSSSFTTQTSRGDVKTHLLQIEYDVDGRTYRSQITGKSSGGTVEIYYNPNAPGEATHAGRLESKSQLWFLLACPVLFLAGLGVMTDGRNPDYEAIIAEAEQKKAAAKARKRKGKGKGKKRRK